MIKQCLFDAAGVLAFLAFVAAVDFFLYLAAK